MDVPSSTWTSSVQLHRRKVTCQPCGWRASPTSEPWSCCSLDAATAAAAVDDDDVRCQSLEVQLELGHVAILRQHTTSDGHTHDWEVYVRPSEGQATSLDALYFVERVEFQLHETYDQRRVVLNEPPFHVVESGYGGFRLPVDVYLRSPSEPRRLHFIYDLQLDSSCSVASVRYEKIVFCNPAKPFRSALRRSGAVSYVSRWRTGLPSSTHQLSASSSAGSSAAATSGYCSNCSELHDTKTPLRLLGLQRAQRTQSTDVTRMTSLNSLVTRISSSSQMTSVKDELDASLQDVKPTTGGSKPGTFLQTWLRQLTSSNVEQHHQPCPGRARPRTAVDAARRRFVTTTGSSNAVTTATGSSKRRKGRPRKYVAAAGDRTLNDDASDSALARSTVDRTEPAHPHEFNVDTNLPAPVIDDLPTTAAGSGQPAANSANAGRGRATVLRRARRQPVKFIPSVDKRPAQQAPKSSRSKSSVARSRSMSRLEAFASVGSGTSGPLKRPRGRPRKHPAVPAVADAGGHRATSRPPVRVERRAAEPTGERLDDVEHSSDSDDVVVIGYTGPHQRHIAPNEPSGGGVQGSTRDSGRTRGRGGGQTRTAVVQPATPVDSLQAPVKRKRGRPRKYPISATDDRMSTGSAGTRAHPSAARRMASGDRNRVTRSLTASHQRHAWNTSRSVIEYVDSPPRPAPHALYCELSSSDDDDQYLIYRPADTCPADDFQRKRRRRSTSRNRSLELSFSSIEKEGGGGDQSRDRMVCADKMTSTPRYDRGSMSTRESTLRSRWINVDQRGADVTTTTALVHHDVDGHPTAPKLTCQTDAVKVAPAVAALPRRQRRRRRRSSDGQDPDWRRNPRPRTSLGSSRPLTSGQSSTESDIITDDRPANVNESELDVLVELQRRLASTSDPRVLRQVVEIIEASGRYQVEDATFDFDLCSLDAATISKLRRCLAV